MKVEQRDEIGLEREIDNQLYATQGIRLAQLLNPAKVVGLQREILDLESFLQQDNIEERVRTIKQRALERKRASIASEKHQVMQQWLMNLFLAQSIVAMLVSMALVYNAVPGYSAPLSMQALGFWSWWLFVIPSLR